MRRRSLWLVAAAVLIAVAAWLMAVGGDGPPRKRADVRFARGPTSLEVQRREARRTLPASAPLPPPAPGQEEPARREPVRDPVLVALPPDPDGSAVVVEANALRHSKIGERLVACLLEQNAEDYRKAQEELGIDPLEDVDRVALSQDVVAVSGFFDGLRWDRLEEPGRAYGGATIYDGAHVARVGDGLVLVGRDPQALEAAVDRVEGRAPAEPPLGEEDAYGEVYGTLGARDLLRMMQGADPQIAAKLEAVAPRMRLHVAADADVSVVADVEGSDAAAMDDLARTLGGTLAMARAQAQVQGDQDLAGILDLARVQPRGDRFGLELALPEALILQQLGRCGDQER